jgi:murein DD-endopeptidase
MRAALRLGGVFLAAGMLLMAGCRTAPIAAPPRPPPAVPDNELSAARSGGASLARSALALLGSPYRFGGANPQGFDCSGLVFYVHGREGALVPRTAAAQRSAARPVSLDALAPGDLVFFSMGTRKVDHVGIYVGDGRFVHAPRSARPVSLQHLDDPYYRRRVVSAGRFWTPTR